ncbi:MAG: hypothetical protein U0524_03360 [Candidatus Saccharimonadales bacterium]
MTREKIAVDIDEVLFPFMPHFLEHHNSQNETNVIAEQFRTYNFATDLGVPLEEAVDHAYSFTGADHGHIRPIEDAKQGIDKLAEKYELSIVTARHPQFEANTLSWVNEHFPDVFSNITFIGFAAIMEKPKTKAEICHALGASTLIDDSLVHVSQCVDAGIDGILFGDYPWNQSAQLPDGIKRCVDWSAVLEHFDGRG